MKELETISTILDRVWEPKLLQKLFMMKIDVSIYDDLKQEITSEKGVRLDLIELSNS